MVPMMLLDREVCYRALRARDKRFDGKFFTAVRTTGIYCRPVCPARTPKLENVLFYSCAAAAEEAGFRPCRRCRPETAPGTPAWNGTATSVGRAVRLIDAGFLNDRSIDELAEILGMGSRHLRRLFIQHLGASPKAVDITRKTHLAARLLIDTPMSIASVAMDAGFSSIRRFNEAFMDSFGVPPRELRRGNRGDRCGSGGCLQLQLPYRAPYDWPGIIGFLRKRIIPGVEEVAGQTYRRSASAGSWRGVVSVAHAPETSSLFVTVDASVGAHLAEIVERVRSMFDLRTDPTAVSEALAKDELLRPLVGRTPGLRVPGVWDPFEAIARAIVGQQISVSAACSLLGTLSRSFGEKLPPKTGQSVHFVFPTAARIAAADDLGVGMPAARTTSLRAAAEAVANGTLNFRRFTSAAELFQSLCALPGIGPWSAEYIMLRGLGEPDAFPSSDLGIRKAVSALEADGHVLIGARQVGEIAERWRPWRGYAAILLWRSLAEAST